MEHRFVAPCATPSPYVGGKRILARRICQQIEAVDHEIYAEPFLGIGGVFLARRFAAPTEIVNDRSRDVVTLFRILQRHIDAFQQMLRFQITSRSDFDRLLATNADTLTDLERAARFLYLQRTSFGGKVAGRSFGVSTSQGARFDVTKLIDILAAIHERIAGVTIENLDFADFLRRYDRPATLFYLDPPYEGAEGFYGANMFDRGRFRALADQLASIAGSFILSVSDTPHMRETFGGFAMSEVAVVYTIAGGSQAQRRTELIISNIRTPRVSRLI